MKSLVLVGLMVIASATAQAYSYSYLCSWDHAVSNGKADTQSGPVVLNAWELNPVYVTNGKLQLTDEETNGQAVRYEATLNREYKDRTGHNPDMLQADSVRRYGSDSSARKLDKLRVTKVMSIGANGVLEAQKRDNSGYSIDVYSCVRN